jgi:hypothetical protein
VAALTQMYIKGVSTRKSAGEILGSILRRSVVTGAATDERAALDSILAWVLAADARDEGRVAIDDDVVADPVSRRDEGGVEAVETLVGGDGKVVTRSMLRAPLRRVWAMSRKNSLPSGARLESRLHITIFRNQKRPPARFFLGPARS